MLRLPLHGKSLATAGLPIGKHTNIPAIQRRLNQLRHLIKDIHLRYALLKYMINHKTKLTLGIRRFAPLMILFYQQ